MSRSDGTNKHPAYWRSLEELADSEAFRAQLAAEFPAEADVADDGGATGGGLNRRRFLQLMSASIAMAGLSGCRWPEETIVPFSERPAGYEPGVPRQFATTFELAGAVTGALVTSYDGRPIKVEGNPEHPGSLGAAGCFAQASVLELYDPDRSRGVARSASGRLTDASWDDFATFAAEHFAASAERRGRGFAVLSEGTRSPSVADLRERLLVAMPDARWYEYEALSRENELAGAEAAFGQPYRSILHLDRAHTIVDFAADLLHGHPEALRHARQFAAGRDPDHEMNRLYVFEAGYSPTGAMADHRIPLPQVKLPLAVKCLAAELFLTLGLAQRTGSESWAELLRPYLQHAECPEQIPALARDLLQHRGHGLIVAGPQFDAQTQALCHICNHALGNTGTTVELMPAGVTVGGSNRADSASVVPAGRRGFAGLRELAADMQQGRVDTLLILGGNPIYAAPADLEFAQALTRVKTSVHLATHRNETSLACTWHLPRAHALESWGDAFALDGTLSAVQPLVAPLWGGRSVAEVLSMITDTPGQSGHDITRRTFNRLDTGQDEVPVDSPAFEERWRRFLHDGYLSAADPPTTASDSWREIRLSAAADEGAHLDAQHFELVFCADAKVHDGRFANNAWLQELPDSVTKLTWDNAALMSPATADALGVAQNEMVRLDYQGRQLELPVNILPGHASFSISVALGYGRTAAGRVGNGVGFDTYRLRGSDAPWGGAGVTVTPTGTTYELASTQDHHAIDSRGFQERERRVGALIRQTDVEHYREHPDFAAHLGTHHPELVSMWTERESTEHRWGMTIDLNTCIGCNACLVACQAENNIPVVGKEQVLNNREMQWLRLDRYFHGEPDAPEVAYQPMACPHCEMAPCEQVCPVAATVHSDEGLNVMVYNRCVGTRYCSNNCPFKVRRFNFFNYQKDLTETQKMGYNPEVTVRGRGVMEKCTYCVQRIQNAKIKAKNEGRSVQDGEILPACGQTCPTEAIVFGDLNDPDSRVAKLQARQRAYRLLEYLNIKPRTAYLARIRNPNPEIAGGDAHGGHGGHDHDDHGHGSGGGDHG